MTTVLSSSPNDNGVPVLTCSIISGNTVLTCSIISDYGDNINKILHNIRHTCSAAFHVYTNKDEMKDV